MQEGINELIAAHHGGDSEKVNLLLSKFNYSKFPRAQFSRACAWPTKSKPTRSIQAAIILA